MSKLRTVHPFPARMAPDLAMAGLHKLPPNSTVLDPMVGSGTVARHAAALGHHAIGFDVDPLAVLMTTVWTRQVDSAATLAMLDRVVTQARGTLLRDVVLPWIDKDEETANFTKYWFGRQQRNDLRKISFLLHSLKSENHPDTIASVDVLRLALSRIIITKENGASLARDVSHSRPHKVTEESDYDVFCGFERAAKQIIGTIAQSNINSTARINLGDARSLDSIQTASIDSVLTSPPYLNAIDYMRGHKMSLVWLGHKISELRSIRSDAIGSEKAGTKEDNVINAISQSMGEVEKLPNKQKKMVLRYAGDLSKMMTEIHRVLKINSTATLVVGNCTTRGIFINNAAGVAKAAIIAGLKLNNQTERDLPPGNRYLPTPTDVTKPLGNRMRTETVMEFIKPR